MTALNKGKHVVSEINGVRCTIVETGVSEERMHFLKDLLELNKFEVKVAEDKRESEDAPSCYTIGVTDIIFNPVIAIYERTLRNSDGLKVSPQYWNQLTTLSDPKYWRIVKR